VLLKFSITELWHLIKPVCLEGMQVFLDPVGQGKNTVCACLRTSAVNLEPYRLMLAGLQIQLRLVDYIGKIYLSYLNHKIFV
jgi:hypothetical protein